MSETVLEQVTATYEIAKEINQKFEENKFLFYLPCCQKHKIFNEKGKFVRNNCPQTPCPDSKHAKFHLSDKRIKIIFGSNRSSKSISGLAEILMFACFKKHPYRKTENHGKGRYRIYGSDFGIIEKLLIPLVKDWIPLNALRDEGASKMPDGSVQRTKEKAWENSWDNKYHILYLKSGNTLDFMSYDQDASKSESVDLDGIWADEQMPEPVYSACLARLITRRGFFWMTVTPLYDISWAMKFLETNDPSVEVFNYDIYDNPYVSETEIRDFEASVPEHEKEARLHGRFLELQGLVYKELRNDIHLVGNDWPKPGDPVVFALDPHPRKPCMMGWAFLRGREDVIFFDEMEISGTARDVVSAIREKERNHGSATLLRLIDPAAKAQGSNLAFETDTLREFEREGMSFTLADNSEAGYNVVHDYLTFDSRRPIGSMNRPRCFFTKNVPRLWYSLSHLMWDEWMIKKQLRDDKERIKDYRKDGADVVRYVLAARPTTRNVIGRGPLPIGNMVRAQQFQNRPNLRSQFVRMG